MLGVAAQRIAWPIRKPRTNADECHCAETRRDGAFRAICFVAHLIPESLRRGHAGLVQRFLVEEGDMRIGVPKEIKVLENRVGLTPGSVREVVQHGHEVVVERNVGLGIGMDDDAYRRAGASILDTAKEVFAAADMIIKVKEPQAIERRMLRQGQVLFTYLHLAPDPEQATDLVASGAVCIAYETVTASSGGLPLLAPMSEVAGRMAVQTGAYYLEKPHGGPGVLLGGVPGVAPARVVILGGGVVGSHACDIALGMGAEVFVLDRSVDVLRALWRQ